MIIGRVIGWLLLVAALIVLGRDIMGWFDTGSFTPIAAGQLWSQLSPSSVESAQQRLWNPILDLLAWPAVLVLGIPGLVLSALFRPRMRRRFRR